MADIERTPTDADDVSAVARHARLHLAPERAGMLAPILGGILGLLDSMDEVKLGETAPAFAYHAKWEGTR